MTEVWKPIKGFEGIYSISNFGRVRKEPVAARILRPRSTGRASGHMNQSYQCVTLCDGMNHRRQAAIHVLVADAFLGERPAKLDVNHRNGNKHDNRPENLEYVSHRENCLHSRRVLKNKGGSGRHHRKTPPAS